LGLVAAAATALAVLSLGSYDQRGGDNWIGPVGESAASALVSAFGLLALWLPVELGLTTLALFRASRRGDWPLRLSSLVVVVLVGCALAHLSLLGTLVFGGHLPGGLAGEVLAEVMRSLLGTAGTYVVCCAVLLINLVLRTSVSVVEIARSAVLSCLRGVTGLYTRMVEALAALSTAWREAKAIEMAERAQR
jgi:hypothetical protein